MGTLYRNLGMAVLLPILLAATAALAQMGGRHGSGPGPGPGETTDPYDAQFRSEHFSGSGNCGRCHDGLVDASGADVSIHVDWSSTAMAHAARDPIWRAKVRTELLRNPALADTINAKCSRCHAPMAHVTATAAGEAMRIFDGGVLDPANPLYDQAMDGVSCSLCHRVAPSTRLGTRQGFSGGYTVDTSLAGIERWVYGPYDDVVVEPMQNHEQFTITFSEHVRQARLCGACHNLFTPFVDADGNVASTPDTEFPEQMPYSEWLHSDYPGRRTCQDCHMPRTDGVVMASRPMWISTLRDDFAIHELVGGNVLLLDLLSANREELGVISANLAETVDRTEAMLAGAAMISAEGAALTSGTLDFTLRITSLTGHKLPTGIPLRRVVLHVTVTDRRGKVVFESGRIDAGGRVTGLDSDLDGGLHEPHYDLITSPQQVQVYETIMEDVSGAVTYTLLRAARYRKDNRLLPSGFSKVAAPDEVAVVGEALTDANFVGGEDLVRFQVGGLSKGRYQVQAELLYQPLSRALVDDMSAGPGGATEIDRFLELYEASPAKAFPITAMSLEVSGR